MVALVAIVLQANLDLVAQSGIVDAGLREIALLLADGEADDLHAERLGGELGETAPAAADFQKLLAGPEIDRFGKPAVLVGLGSGQIGRVVLEQGRRISHARIEPRRIERVANVVMRVDIAARLPPGVAIE